MQHHVHVYQIDRNASATAPAEADEHASFAVEAETHEAARLAALDQLAVRGHTVRSLSFLVEGGMAAVVTQAAPRPTPANVQRALRRR